ncbi:MAG: UDP-N-acetylmuramoyl-L-alanyl-D-glutamate--2,6-diaminopimelate ligase [Firmicutes bacterium]|nr:UDP-N-acetylmuramoyl-L-alanyl-D-glutamate--2,6-diaminopimelate ligase [Bacillota bacterium]
MATLEYITGQIPGAYLAPDYAQVRFTGIAYDSRKVVPGNIFVCITGYRFDGHAYAEEAVGAGAVAVICERSIPGLTVPQIIVPDSRKALALAAAAYWGHPTRNLRLFGVTGTNGKTTTTYLLKRILEAAGHKTGLVGTIKNLIGDRELKAEHTTPEASDLQQLFAQMQAEGVSHVVMEVSSHAIVLDRILGSEFDLGAFTNITQDHLDFHQTFENYLQAKISFFERIGVDSVKLGPKGIALNCDDPNAEEISRVAKVPVLLYGLGPTAQVRAVDLELDAKGTRFTVETPAGVRKLQTRLLGQFNVYNCLAAIATALLEGLDLDLIVSALTDVTGVRGRAELVDLGQDFAVVVDYAHTPDGLANILSTARAITANRLAVVFGCGGDRDRTKRPEMGRIAGELADRVFVTSDNPRSEDPLSICQDIVAGLELSAAPNSYEVIVDRREAIAAAIRWAEPGDVVVIAGKGHEDYQIFRDKIIHFDDREEAVRILQESLGKGK